MHSRHVPNVIVRVAGLRLPFCCLFFPRFIFSSFSLFPTLFSVRSVFVCLFVYLLNEWTLFSGAVGGLQKYWRREQRPPVPRSQMHTVCPESWGTRGRGHTSCGRCRGPCRAGRSHLRPQHKSLKHDETFLRSCLLCSSAVVSVSVFSVWPETSRLLPAWPREAEGLDTRAHGTVLHVLPQSPVKGPLLPPLYRWGNEAGDRRPAGGEWGAGSVHLHGAPACGVRPSPGPLPSPLRL